MKNVLFIVSVILCIGCARAFVLQKPIGGYKQVAVERPEMDKVGTAIKPEHPENKTSERFIEQSYSSSRVLNRKESAKLNNNKKSAKSIVNQPEITMDKFLNTGKLKVSYSKKPVISIENKVEVSTDTRDTSNNYNRFILIAVSLFVLLVFYFIYSVIIA